MDQEAFVSEPTIRLAIDLTADELDVICADVNHGAERSYDAARKFTFSEARAKRTARGDMRIELANRIRAAAIGRALILDGGVWSQEPDGPAYVGNETTPAVHWLAQLLYSCVGRNVRISFEEMPMETKP